MLQAETALKEVARKSFIPDSKRIGKTQLCAELGWSRPKLDRVLERDPRFPVAWRGGTGKGRAWGFDLDAVQDYLKTHPDAAEDTPAIPESTGQIAFSGQNPDSTGSSDVTKIEAPRNAEHAGERTGRQRRDEAQAALLEDKLRKDRGELVQVEDLRNNLTTVMARLGKGLDALPDAIVDALSIAPAHGATIREIVYKLRTNLVTELQAALRSDAG